MKPIRGVYTGKEISLNKPLNIYWTMMFNIAMLCTNILAFVVVFNFFLFVFMIGKNVSEVRGQIFWDVLDNGGGQWRNGGQC